MCIAQTTIRKLYWFFSLEKAADISDKNITKAFKNFKKRTYKPSAYRMADGLVYRDAYSETKPFAKILCKIPDNIKEDNYLDYLRTEHPEIFI